MIKVLFACKVGESDWAEELITEDESQFEAAQKWATANGYDRFRIAKIQLNKPLDFLTTLNS